MFISAGLVASARSRGNRQLAKSAVPGEPFARVDDVVDLLSRATSPAAQPGARALLKQMAAESWKVIRGAHQSLKDATRHVTVEVGGDRYHLRLDGRECVFDITRVVNKETERPAGRLPWVGPGA